MRRVIALAVSLLLAEPASAQVAAGRPAGDPRLQTVPYDAARVVRLRVPLGYQTTIILNPDEEIDTIAVGDSDAWSVAPTARGDHVVVKPLAAGHDTNLTIVTDARIYAFELSAASGPGADTPFTLRFAYPDLTAETTPPPPAQVGAYRLSGDPSVRPSAVTDDGARTYISWPEPADLPAVSAIDARGRELLVTGHMREGRFVIDAVYPTLLFRLDRRVARAARQAEGRR